MPQPTTFSQHSDGLLEGYRLASTVAAQMPKTLKYYACRWQVEVYFRILKSDCKIEDRQFESADHYLPCLALYMVIAWRVMYVMMLGRTCPEMSCGELFSEAEWKAVYTVVRCEPAPETPPTLQEMIALIGRLGGHMGRRHDGPPGTKAMWVGTQRMMDLTAAWEAFGLAARAARKRKKMCITKRTAPQATVKHGLRPKTQPPNPQT